MSTQVEQRDEEQINTTQDDGSSVGEEVAPKKTKKRSKKTKKVDEDGNPIKKPRMTRKRKYPLVTATCRRPYQIYLSEKAAENKAANLPPKSATEYAADWKNETDKSKWENLAKEDLENFIKEVKAKGYEYEEPSNKKPKQPSGAFLLYARDNAKRLQKEKNLKYPEALTELGEIWRGSIDPEEKQRYIDQARKDKEEYNAIHKKDEN